MDLASSKSGGVGAKRMPPPHRRPTSPDKGLDPGIGTSACHLEMGRQTQLTLSGLHDPNSVLTGPTSSVWEASATYSVIRLGYGHGKMSSATGLLAHLRCMEEA